MKIKSIILFGMLACHASTALSQSALDGRWEFMASNNGKVVNGVYSAGNDTIPFTATASADGTYLQCHADTFFQTTNGTYPADWRMLVETDETGRFRLGWVLDEAEPFSSEEFPEPKASYMDDGFFYWGGTDGGHRYMYLLAENADASAIIGMTFWSDWTTTADAELSLANADHNSRKMYLVVAEGLPYSNSVGWLEIWASPKIRRVSGDQAAIKTVVAAPSEASSCYYDLLGRPLQKVPRRGLYIRRGVANRP